MSVAILLVGKASDASFAMAVWTLIFSFIPIHQLQHADRLGDEWHVQFYRLGRKLRFWQTLRLICVLAALYGTLLPERWKGWLGVPGPILVLTFWKIHKLSRRHAHEVRRRDASVLGADAIGSLERSPVLYLRSFDDDPAAASLTGVLTEEEYLAIVLGQIGPFVAVGRPGEFKPHAGASRVYLEHQSWQPRVEAALRGARLVVIRTGRTTGLDWEVERAVRVLTPERLVLLVDDRRELAALLNRISLVHPQVRASMRMGWRSVGSVKGFIVFDDAWQASRLRIRGPGLLVFCDPQGGTFNVAKLGRTLQPVFRRLNLRWQRPPFVLGMVPAFYARVFFKLLLLLLGMSIIGQAIRAILR